MDNYNDILERMILKYKELSGNEISNESDIMIRLKVLAGEIYSQKTSEDFLLRQMFPTTATGRYLDMHAAERGLNRKSAIKTKGKLRFYCDQAATQNITVPKGCIVCTYNDGVRFECDNDYTIEAGQTYVTADVTALEAGAVGNVNGGTITVIVTPVAGVDRVYNGAVFKGGVDEETDESLRQRLLDSYKNVSNGTNKAYYKSLALSVAGVYSVGVIPKNRGTGTVDVFVCAQGEEVSSDVLGEVNELLQTQREVNVDVRAFNASGTYVQFCVEIAVAEGYDFNTVKEKCIENVENYISALGIGQDVLLSNIGDILHHTEGVYNYNFITSYGTDVVIEDDEYPLLDEFIVRQVSSS